MVVAKRSYRKLKEKKLAFFASNFKLNLFLSAAVFPSPPFTASDMQTAIENYQSAAKQWRAERSSYNSGQTLVMRTALIDILDAQVKYVEATAPDENAVRAAGLEPVALVPKKAPLPGSPTGGGAKMSAHPQSVILFCKPIQLGNSTAQVTYYVFETNAEGTVEFGLMTSSTDSRKMEFGSLTTGKVYYFYIRGKTSTGFGPPSKVIRWVGQ